MPSHNSLLESQRKFRPSSNFSTNQKLFSIAVNICRGSKFTSDWPSGIVELYQSSTFVRQPEVLGFNMKERKKKKDKWKTSNLFYRIFERLLAVEAFVFKALKELSLTHLICSEAHL